MTDSTQSAQPAADLTEDTGTELTEQQRETPKLNLESPHDAARRAIEESAGGAQSLIDVIQALERLDPETAALSDEELSKRIVSESNAMQSTFSMLAAKSPIDFLETTLKGAGFDGLQEAIPQILNGLQAMEIELQNVVKKLEAEQLSLVPDLNDQLSEILQHLTEFNIMQSADLSDSLTGFSSQIQDFVKSSREYFDQIKPYIEKELEQLHETNPETESITIDDLSIDAIYLMQNKEMTDQELAEWAKDYQNDDPIAADQVIKHYDLIVKAVRAAQAKLEADKEKAEQPITAHPIPLLKSTLPKKHIMPIQRLANELQHGTIIDKGLIDLVVGNRGKKNEIKSVVLATYEQPDGVTMTGKPYTEYDRQVQDAVSSLWEFGDKSHIITPESVFRAMTHRTQTETPSPQQIGAVTKSLEKMRRIHVTVDATDEMQRRKVTVDGKRVASCKFDDSLLSLRAVEVKAGGKIMKAYKITAEPVLLTYAKLTKQIATVSAELLDIKKVDKGKATTVSIANSDARIAVKGYILRRIEIMKRDRKNKNQKQSNIILFDSIFEETDTPSKNAERVKVYAFQVLDYYTATGYINGYTKRKKAGRGGGFDAVVIDL